MSKPWRLSRFLAVLAALIELTGTATRGQSLFTTARVELNANLTSPAPELVPSASSTMCASGVGPFLQLACSGVDLANVFQLAHSGVSGDFGVVTRIYKSQKVTAGFTSDAYRSETTPTLLLLVARFTDIFGTNTPVTVANAKWRRARAGYRWDVLETPRGRLGVDADVNYSRMSAFAGLRDFPTGPSLQYARTLVVPAFGASGEAVFTRYVSAGGDIALSRWRAVGFRDLDVFAVVNIVRRVGARIGYRETTVNQHVADAPAGASPIDDGAGHLKTKGPYAGTVVRF